mmetsp:Transcript_16019/g.44096  ORF Transcript_16019/g.44096 Transcript_16019/m.44096 type:complete len:85 (-) Transcript_16019:26-280(-)
MIGHVVEAEMKGNEVSGKPFYWALVRTVASAEADVVIHPGLLERKGMKPPIAGQVVQGLFYLSGVLMFDAGDKEDSRRCRRVTE